MHELDGAKLKVKRAKTHINSLNRRIKRFMATNEYVLVEDIDPQTLKKSYHLDGTSLPLDVGIVIADIVANLRSSLDFIAWELSVHNTPPISEADARGVFFPLLLSPNAGTIEGNCKWMCSDAVDIIKELQPYNSSIWPELELLRTLQELSRIARHRIITETVVFTSLRIFYADRITDVNLAKSEKVLLEKGALIEITEASNPRIPLDIAFTVQTQGIRPIPSFSIAFLNDIHNFIRDEVTPRFIPCFSQKLISPK